MRYDFQTLKEAILFNAVETLPGDESQLDEEIQVLVEEANKSGEPIRHYIGFEVSGQIHIGTGIASALKIKKLQDAGVHCSIFLADYHTFLNNKLDGRLDTIRKVAKEYFGPVMLKCCRVVGCDTSKVDLVYAQDLYETKPNGQNFLTFVLKIAQQLTLNRVLKSVSVMGKDLGENVDFGTLEYPVMQVADAFFMQTQIVHAGLDQRKCHVLMREIASKLDDDFTLKIGQNRVKPLAVHHNLLLGLEKKDDQNREISKMSKSKPDSAIWVHDDLTELERKLRKAYCPLPQTEQPVEEISAEQAWNPLLDWCKNMIYPGGQIIQISRPERFGGDVSYPNYKALEADYFAGKLHPLDLKNGVAQTLAKWFAPIRDYVEQYPDGLNLVKNIKK
jgi:tyrosyl-tRNA synthetase